MALVVKNLPANAGDLRDSGSIPGLGRSPGGWYGNPLQYSCLENLKDRGTWWAIVPRVTNSQTRLKRLDTNMIILMFEGLLFGEETHYLSFFGSFSLLHALLFS